MVDSLSPQSHVQMHYLCGEVFDGVPRPNLTKTFGNTNVADLAGFVQSGPETGYG
ncbi:MAG: hypothetical protein KDI65_06505 [Alphaproteobacteria bacterium]|nr:hypothetical protein [Alphaproteobacteria bacterium]